MNGLIIFLAGNASNSTSVNFESNDKHQIQAIVRDKNEIGQKKCIITIIEYRNVAPGKYTKQCSNKSKESYTFLSPLTRSGNYHWLIGLLLIQ